MIRRDFNRLAKEFEETLQQLASDVAGGVLFERLPGLMRCKCNLARLPGQDERNVRFLLPTFRPGIHRLLNSGLHRTLLSS